MKHESHYKMFIFLPLTALFGVFFAFYGFAFFGKMHYMSVEFPTYLHTKLTTQSAQKIDILVLGDSRAKAGFIPQGANHLNLAIGGSTPFDGYHTLKRFLAHNAPPKALILSYIPAHYFGIGTFWDRAVKFGFIDFIEFSELLNNARNLGECALFGKCYKIKFFYYHLNYENFNAEIFNTFKQKTWQESRFMANKKAWEYLEAKRGHFFYGRANGTSGEFMEVAMKSFAPNALHKFYLQKIANLAKAHNIAVFHYQMPFNKSSFNALDLGFVREYNVFLDSMEANYGIVALNRIWEMPDSAFGDPSHLFSGAEEVTRDILEKLRQKGF